MGKTESAAVGEETELKKELERVVKTIVQEDDIGLMTIKATRVLCSLVELKLKQPVDLQVDDTVLPDKFKCPLSGEIMCDPVVLASGQTYDRPHIQKWLNEGNRTCPLSKRILSHTMLTPNHLVRELISDWCKERGIALPNSYQDVDANMNTEVDRFYLNSLLEKMSSSLSDQQEAAKELRRLTKTARSYRAAFCKFTDDSISRLLSPMLKSNVDFDPGVEEDLITTVLNLSIHGNNKKLIAEHPIVIPLLIDSMKFGTIETRRNAAAALFSLSALESNRFIIGNSGALVPLLQLLSEGHPLAMKDAASAIYNLCFVSEIKAKFIEIGLVNVILQKIKDGILVDELSLILAMLSTHQNAVDELWDLDTLCWLLQLIRDSSSSEIIKENCVAILYNVCSKDMALLMVIRAEEIKRHTLTELAETGTRRARRKAIGIIKKICIAFPTTQSLKK